MNTRAKDVSSDSRLSRAGARKPACLLALLFLFVLACATSAAAQDDGESAEQPGFGLPGISAVAQGVEEGASFAVEPTDPSAAEGVAHRDLGRAEALELMQNVFGSELQDTVGVFDELTVEKFLSPHVAVLPGSPSTGPSEEVPSQEVPSQDVVPVEEFAEGEKPGANLPTPAEEAEAEIERLKHEKDGEPAQLANATLLDSTVPLKTEGASGDEEVVNLGLERSEGELRPANPLVEVGVPEQIGEGIELPESGITIKVPGASPDRVASMIEDSVAAYPNVVQDTDLAVAPTPTGVETLTQIRSAESPRSQSYDLELPAGATLVASEDGGATVRRGDDTLMTIAPPWAVDAAGSRVPVNMQVNGTGLTLQVEVEESTQFPVLLDPLFQTYEWMSSSTKRWEDGICDSSFEFHSFNQCNNREEWGISGEAGGGAISEIDGQFWGTAPTQVPQGTPGLYVRSQGEQKAGGWGGWIYTVPRYFTDQTTYGKMPTSYISHLTLSKLLWQAYSSNASPYLFNGIWDPVKSEWVSAYSHSGGEGHGLNDMTWQYQFPNENPQHEPDVNAKVARVSIASTEAAAQGNTDVYVGSASVELGDKEAPSSPVISAPTAWVNEAPSPIVFTATDTGLGVRTVTASTEEGGGISPHSWSASYGCQGVGDSACPRTWKSSEAGHPALKYEPSIFPTGVSYLKVVAEDPIGNKSAPGFAEVKVDHTAPSIALSGTLTEQAALGLKRPSYTLKANVTDGTTGAPQSGAAKAFIEFDGQVVAESQPGCATQNCVIPLEWQLESSKYAAGQHSVKVRAYDAVGLLTTKTLSVELNPSPPSLSISGSMTEQATLGTTRPRYTLKESAAAEAGLAGAPPPTYASSFGAAGTGNGQFAHPGDVAIDAKGNLWVADENNNRIEEFNEKGEFLKAFGSYGTGNGQFKRPKALAFAPNGNLWVADGDNCRLEQFNEKGEFLKAVGSLGSGNGQFNGPEGIAIDAKGNIWVADTYNARIQEFNEKGEFLKAVGTRGSGTGQLIEPTGIDIGPGGNVWVTDWSNNKVVVFNEAGEYVRQFGSEGIGNGQFHRPDAIAIDTRGDVWVGDQNNERVQEFNQAGEYVAQFGAAGAGAGQFSFGYPMGIAVDSKGNLWVTDTGNNRVQKWAIPGYTPTYASSFGASGTGNGQFAHPADVAVDAKGNLWIPDENNNRIEQFNEKGEFLKAVGAYGTGNGQFKRPKALAFASNGNFWVADGDNNRLEQFNEKGEFIKAVGSSGSGNGQFNGPEGIAIDAKGNLWVADTYNHRIQEFNEKGEFIKVANPSGMGAIEPEGIAAGPGGNIWFADWSHNRVVELSEVGALVRVVGSLGTGNGQFATPDDVTVDAQGTVWVVDQQHERIEGFNQAGEYLTQFGTKGSGAGQFSLSDPIGIAADAQGNLWVTDPGNNRVQKWSTPTSHSEVSTEITLDGKKVDSGAAACSTEHCPVVREWSLQQTPELIGKHTVVVKAADGLGNTSSKTLTMEFQKDTTNPSLEAGGSLVKAPEGWVEQEGYGLTATAKDAGYGVTSLVFKIDGKEVAGAGRSCSEGGCEASLQKTIDMAPYSGGAHPAELVATDGAGNEAIQKWTLNVDPDGHISTQELAATLEAVEETSPVNPIGEGEPNEQPIGVRPDIGVVETASGFEATGSQVPLSIAANPANGIVASIPEADVFSDCAEPASTPTEDPDPETEPQEETEAEQLAAEKESEDLKSATSQPCTAHEEAPLGEDPLSDISISPSGSTTSAVVGGVESGTAAVAADTSSNGDTIIRPIYEGALDFQAIRSVTAPEKYSWEVHLEPGQFLESLDNRDAEVYYASGHPAFEIAAEPAHDAVGTEVATTLSVESQTVITLAVEHHARDYVYPVVAGVGWRGGFVSTTIQGPKDEKELREEHERELREEQERREEEEDGEIPNGTAVQSGNTWFVHAAVIGPPVSGIATASSASDERVAYHRFRFSDCRYKAFPESIAPPDEPFPPDEHAALLVALIGNCVREQDEKDELNTAMMVDGWFAYNQYGWVWVDQKKPYDMNCPSWGPHKYAKVNCFARPWKTKGELTVRGDFRGFLVTESAECVTVYGHLNTEVPHRVAEESIVSLTGAGSVFEKCDWPG